MNRRNAATVRNLLQARHPDAVVTVTPEDDGAQIVIVGKAGPGGVSGSSKANRVTMSVSDNGMFLRNLLTEAVGNWQPGKDLV